MSFIFVVKWMNKLKVDPSYLLCTCVRLLTGWVDSSRQMPFAIPMVWAEQKDHSSDCHFCLTEIKGITSKSKNTEKDPEFPSAKRLKRSVACTKSSKNLTYSNYDSDFDEDHGQQDGDNVDSNPIFEASCPSSEPHLLTPGDLNNHDLNFPD